ncbi:hypothetical protein PI124_g24176 [Phytophthora idaei]|nr:hypothetical protein PI125_g25660 [Phytophthora idaei]KAG3124739.1 hypothetical protein PI126_g23105 [Phytophthora idaei]KAG3230726.1 hypothetical protein PI124_g24176 [Phytophthora idaei]
MLLDGGQHHEGADHGMDDQIARSSRLSRLIETVYADFNEENQPDNYFAERIILTPKNADVLAINDMILDKLPGDAQEYRSVDTLDGDDELERQERSDLYPPEFVNTISLSGMPPHKLRLKIGTPVMLLRNINTKEGLCNGTRLWVVSLRRNYMQAVIMGGAFAGKKVLIPRIALISKNSGFPFELLRKQSPVQVAFAMTINKSQGQSIQILGLYLPEPVFSHGRARRWAYGRRLTDATCFGTYAEFKEELRQAFEPPKNESHQRAEFLDLQQGKHDVHAFAQRARYLVSNIVTNPMDDATKVVTFMKGLRDGPVKTYLFREYPSTLEAAITLAMQEEFSLRQAKLHVNVPRMARPVMRTGGPEPMDPSNATAAGH